MFNCKYLRSAVCAALCIAGIDTAQADVLFNNPTNFENQSSTCVYNIVCGPFYTGDTYVAQEFLLSNASLVETIEFTSVVNAGSPPSPYRIFGTAANYQILAANGFGGIPGTVLQSGLGSPLTHTQGQTGSNGWETTIYSFNLPPLQLSAGSYYVAFQLVTTNFNDIIEQGTGPYRVATSDDGGVTYHAGFYTGNPAIPSVAISVIGTLTPVPEPASLALLALGLAGLGFARRRKSKSVAV